MIQCMKFKSANTLQSMWSPVACFQLNMLNPTTALLVLVATFRFVVPRRSSSFTFTEVWSYVHYALRIGMCSSQSDGHETVMTWSCAHHDLS